MRLNVGSTRSAAGFDLPYWSLSQARQAQGQERGRVHLPLRGSGRARGGRGCGSTASSAAISTPPRRASFGELTYYNDGDWVESCTALVEHRRPDGDPPLGRRNRRASCRACRRRARTRRAGRRLMRILIVTDAWAPQVNGVVRTLQSVRARARAPRATRSMSSRPTCSARFPARPIPRSGWRWPAGARSARGSRRSRPTRCTSRPRGRSGSPRGAGACARGRAFTTAYHTQFPEYLASATRLPAGAVLALHPLVPPARGAAHGRDRDRRGAAARQGLAQTRRGAAASTSLLPARRRRRIRPSPACSGRSSSTSAASRSRRTSRRSSPAAIPGTKVVVGDGPALAALQRAVSRGALPRRAARRGACRVLRRRPTCSSSRAAPTPSGWS